MEVSDELVERVMERMIAAVLDDPCPNGEWPVAARAAIAALSTPEFVMPLAEEMLRGANIETVKVYLNCVELSAPEEGELSFFATRPEKALAMLDGYRAAKGE